MNIAIFTDTYPPFINGVSTSCYNLVQILKKHGHHVIVVAPRMEDGPFIYKDEIAYVPGIELKNLYNYRLTNIYSKKVINILKENHIELIHNQTDGGIGQFAKIASRNLNIPIVYTYHTSYEDYTYYLIPNFLDRLAKRVVRTYSRGLAKNATEFITPSTKTKDYMRSLGSDAYINIIPSGIDFDMFSKERFDVEKAEKFKLDNKINKDTLVFLLLGRLAKEKSMDFSLECFAEFSKRNPKIDTKMIVVGNGPQKAELEQLTDKLNIVSKVIFVGAVSSEEVAFYYHLADIYTSASQTETQGLTFMEAMASSTIVLARFDTNLNETIIDNETGFYFTDIQSFIDKTERIINLSDKEKNQIIENALKIADKYSIERFYENVMGVYRRALRKYW